MKCTKHTHYHLRGKTVQYISVNNIHIHVIANMSVSQCDFSHFTSAKEVVLLDISLFVCLLTTLRINY